MVFAAVWQDKSLDVHMDPKKRVLVLLTGGTMAMKPNKNGALEPCTGFLARQMRAMPELREVRMPAYSVLEYDPLLDSADMIPSDWSTIASDIASHHDSYDGFVVSSQRRQLSLSLVFHPAEGGTTKQSFGEENNVEKSVL